jgi:hypothetical protein
LLKRSPREGTVWPKREDAFRGNIHGLCCWSGKTIVFCLFCLSLFSKCDSFLINVLLKSLTAGSEAK